MDYHPGEQRSPSTIQHDGYLTMAIGRRRQEMSWKNNDWLWSQLLASISNTIRTHETVEEYQGASKSDQDDIKDIGGFVGGSQTGGHINPKRLQVGNWSHLIQTLLKLISGTCSGYVLSVLVPLFQPISTLRKLPGYHQGNR